MPDTKLYEILGVSKNASDQEIKKVCRTKIKKRIFI
jgi:curved DNA-binding protein CbpA